MGLIIDTNVLIHHEKAGTFPDPIGNQPTGGAFVSVVTISELLVGMHYANTEERRKARSEFVDKVISIFTTLDFTLDMARIHAELFADLRSKGKMIGAHDLIIAATARYHKLDVLTDNTEEFSRVPNLNVVAFVA